MSLEAIYLADRTQQVYLPARTEGLPVPVDKLFAEQTKRVSELREAQDKLKRLEQDRVSVQRQDAEALGRAMRKGAKDPGPVHFTAYLESVANATRYVAGCTEALISTKQELEAAVIKAQPAIVKSAKEVLEADRALYAKAVNQLASAIERLSESRRQVAWAQGPLQRNGDDSGIPEIPPVNVRDTEGGRVKVAPEALAKGLQASQESVAVAVPSELPEGTGIVASGVVGEEIA